MNARSFHPAFTACALAMFLLVLHCPRLAHAGEYGKVAGRVTDAATREPLPGVQVYLEGTLLGAVTDENGWYTILQVSPGTYAVAAQLIGYRTVLKRDAGVSSDLTRREDFSLEPTPIELEPQEIIAQRPLVVLDATSSIRSASRDEVERLPDIRDFQDVVALQPGAVGKGSGIHIRGGRSGEVLYMVDGIPIRHPIYSGTAALTIPVKAIEEIEILTGGFNAEYGNAQSGVVNIVTREGAERYVGSVEYRTDQAELFDSWNTDQLDLTVGGPEPLTSYLLPAVGVRMPGNMSLFVTSSSELTDTYLPWGEARSRLEPLSIDLGDERQNNSELFDAKLTHAISGGALKTSLGYRGEWRTYDAFDWAWKDLPDRTMDYCSMADQWTVSVTYAPSEMTFGTIRYGRLATEYHADVNGMTPPDYYETSLNDSSKTPIYIWWKDTNADGFMEGDSLYPGEADPRGAIQMSYRDDRSHVNTYKADVTSQVTPAHLVKAGLEVNDYHVSYTDLQYVGWQYTPGRDSLPGPWPEYGLYRWVFDGDPLTAAAYVQDKMEFEGLIVNAGLRLDLVRPGTSFDDADYQTQWENITDMDLTLDETMAIVSPRLGLSHPVTDRMMMYFSYGRFTQFPEFQYYYRDPWTGTYVGNPNLKPERTTSYEYGFAYEILPGIGLDIKGFAKDMRDYVGQILVGDPPVQLWTNLGYGSARGAELQIKKRYGNYLGGTFNYTYQWALGYSNSAYLAYDYGAGQRDPLRESRLSWDQRHSITADLEFRVPRGDHPRVFGLAFPDDWAATALWQYGSGLPYTPLPQGLLPETNTATAPHTSTLDLHVERTFRFGATNATLLFDVLNVLDNENVVDLGSSFNAYEGRPYVYGDVEGESGRIVPYVNMRYLNSPARLGPPRTARLGLRLSW